MINHLLPVILIVAHRHHNCRCTKEIAMSGNSTLAALCVCGTIVLSGSAIAQPYGSGDGSWMVARLGNGLDDPWGLVAAAS